MPNYQLCSATIVEWKMVAGDKVPETTTPLEDICHVSNKHPEIRLLTKHMKDLAAAQCKTKVGLAYDGLLTVEGMICQNIGS